MHVPSLYEKLLPDFAASLSVLPDKPEETAESTLNALWYAAADQPRSAEAASFPLPDLSAEGENKLRALLRQRLDGAPLAHLTQRQHFMGLELIAGPAALVPRKETELLATTALEKLRNAGAAPLVIDVCTGSGNIAVSLAHLLPAATIFASDLSEDAVALARQNAQFLGVQDRVTFSVGDLFGGLPRDRLIGMTDVVICNPPYISTSKVGVMAAEISQFEPRLAFDGGAFGLTIVTRLMREAPEFMKPGSWLCFEIGKGQGKFLANSLSKVGCYDLIEPKADFSGEIRVLTARLGAA